MTYTVNGQPTTLAAGATVRDVVRQLTDREITDEGRTPDGAPLGLAVAVDGFVVPRRLWATTTIAPGSAIEVVEAVQGG